MRRLLAFLILFGALALMLRHLVRMAFRSVRTPGGDSAHRPLREELVRDRVCNTFLPREKALRLSAPGGILYFCSEICLERYRSSAEGLTGDGGDRRIASTSPS